MSSQLDIAARAVELVRAAAGPGAQAEAYVEHTALALTRFANSYIHQNVADAATLVRLRLHVDGRTASGSTTLTSDEGLSGLVERTLAAAGPCPPDPAWPGLTPPTPATGDGNWDADTAQAAPEQRADRVRAFVDAAEGLEAAGFCRTTTVTAGFANSAGQSLAGRTTEAAMEGVVRAPGADGTARLAGVRLADLDAAVLGARAAAKARAGADPVELPPGRYEVVLEPTAVQDLLVMLSVYGFNGKALNERRSFAVPGTAQFDRAVTLRDDPLDKDAPGMPFDIEGTPRRPLTLVEAGVTAAVAHDRRTAVQAGSESTGHAIPGSATWGPLLRNVCLGPAAADTGPAREVPGPAADSDTAGLIGGVGRGLLVTDLWYTRVLDPRTLVMTGLTRNGVWLIENGEVTRPVRNLRFTQSYPQALGPGAVLGIGGHAVTLPGGWGVSHWQAPALRLASWNFTGGASG